MTWPVLSKQSDSSQYRVEYEDPSMTTEVEGGYVLSRARYTRAPRKRFTIGYVNLSQADRDALEAFWNIKKGGSEPIIWDNPEDGQTYTVRFHGGPLQFQYVGLGGIHRYNVSIQLQQV